MPRKCCIPLCKSNYDAGPKAVVYRFPSDKDEFRRWLGALPSQVKNVTRHMGICDKHWPHDAPRIKIKRFFRPVGPPSIFSLPTSSIRQTFPVTSRQSAHRGILCGQRNKLADEIDAFNAKDRIQNWETFISHIMQNLLPTMPGWLLQREESYVQLLSICQRNVEFSVTVDSNFKIAAFRRNTEVKTSDLLGFQNHLERFSQLEAIINRVKQTDLSIKDEISAHVKDLQSVCSDAGATKQQFLLRQLQLSTYESSSMRYTFEDILLSARMFFSGRAGYCAARGILTLPHPVTLKRYFGGLGTVGTDADCQKLVEAQLSAATQSQKCCSIIFDEVYVPPSLRLRGGHIIGYSEDDPAKLARTVLAIMVKPLMGAIPYVARLVPIYSLKPHFLYEQIARLISIIHNCGGVVISLICDNHFTNRNCFELFSPDPATPWKAANPADPTQPLFLLYDTVHLIKNIRNNWLTQSHGEIDFQLPGEHGSSRAKWSHIVDIEVRSRSHIIRPTTLTSVSCCPTPLERQKVSLVLDVFSEKTVAALQVVRHVDTANFVAKVVDFWKIVNVKTPDAHVLLNDIRRTPISSPDAANLHVLLNFASIIGRMAGGRGPCRPRSLTTETQKAVVQTSRGLVEMSQYLLSHFQFKYVMLGMNSIRH
ncbi:hypothetical protein BOX15_Mlig018626g1 [Macrostomum lignano]|uniref:THAP-type domain-containing protein n=1 Tax=Macrostomum lignano TaxID=282301 RepID=A0A267GL00_9PLAT|nr:hypothetical protein BOX15_Mlig018626g1 [Macrostomum lignano]